MKPIRDRQVFPQWLHVTFSVYVKRVPVFPPSPFVFHVGRSSGCKGSGDLADCASPVHAVGCLCCSLTVINVTSGEGLFQSVFVSFLRCPGPLSQWSVDNTPYSMTFGMRWSSSEAVFSEAWPQWW